MTPTDLSNIERQIADLLRPVAAELRAEHGGLASILVCVNADELYPHGAVDFGVRLRRADGLEADSRGPILADTIKRAQDGLTPDWYLRDAEELEKRAQDRRSRYAQCVEVAK